MQKAIEDIIAEHISEDEGTRNVIRSEFQRFAVITSKVIKTKKDICKPKYCTFVIVETPMQ